MPHAIRLVIFPVPVLPAGLLEGLRNGGPAQRPGLVHRHAAGFCPGHGQAVPHALAAHSRSGLHLVLPQHPVAGAGGVRLQPAAVVSR
ncbi:hypothetical protein D9M72_626540 [compost metagenome]